ncbi:MAG: hypothetical protein ACT4QD_09665 [Acidobacteriota bacterium]
MRLAVIGVVAGLALALALTRFIESQLVGVSARDGTVFAGVAVVLLLTAVVACYLPARASTRVDPAVALRQA